MTYCREETSLHFSHGILHTVSWMNLTGYWHGLDKHAVCPAESSIGTAMKQRGVCQAGGMTVFGKDNIKNRHQKSMRTGVMTPAPRIDRFSTHIRATGRDMVQCRRWSTQPCHLIGFKSRTEILPCLLIGGSAKTIFLDFCLMIHPHFSIY